MAAPATPAAQSVLRIERSKEYDHRLRSHHPMTFPGRLFIVVTQAIAVHIHEIVHSQGLVGRMGLERVENAVSDFVHPRDQAEFPPGCSLPEGRVITAAR